jgi:hypothetical protein
MYQRQDQAAPQWARGGYLYGLQVVTSDCSDDGRAEGRSGMRGMNGLDEEKSLGQGCTEGCVAGIEVGG